MGIGKVGFFGTGRDAKASGSGISGIIAVVDELSHDAFDQARDEAMASFAVEDDWQGDVLLLRTDGVDSDGHAVPVEVQWTIHDEARAAETAQLLDGELAASPAAIGASIVMARATAGLGKKIDGVLDRYLLGERPLLAARVHCIVPMRYEPLDCALQDYAALRTALIARALDGTDGYSVEEPAGGEHFFLPHARKLLGATAGFLRDKRGAEAQTAALLDERIVTVTRSLAGGETLMMEMKARSKSPVKARLTSLRMHFYAEATIALEWVYELETPEALSVRSKKR